MPLVTFGLFEFDPESGELRRSGRRVRLQRQPARMLAVLLAQPGQVVGRDALQKAIWGADTHVDFERGLNFCAAQIRTALGDSASEPRYLETVPRQGYRFIAPVRETDAASAIPPEVPLAKRRAMPVAVAAMILLLAVVSGWLIFLAARNERPPTVAVVPFENETGSTAFDRAAKDLSDGTVARLATAERLPRLRVIGNAAALRFTFVPRDLQAMGRSLNAEFIVLGQVKGNERRVQVVAHLIRVSDQTHVWANTYERDELDLAAQGEIAEAIASAITGRISTPSAPDARR